MVGTGGVSDISGAVKGPFANQSVHWPGDISAVFGSNDGRHLGLSKRPVVDLYIIDVANENGMARVCVVLAATSTDLESRVVMGKASGTKASASDINAVDPVLARAGRRGVGHRNMSPAGCGDGA